MPNPSQVQPSSPSSDLPSSKTAYGHSIESLALEWFLTHHPGSLLLGRNFRTKAGEIDLIFETSGKRAGSREIAFVEVRARARSGWVSAVESVTAVKRQRLAKAARHWLALKSSRAETAKQGSHSGLRFDIMAWDGHTWIHLIDAWHE